jgi:hypothetical protein
VGLYALAREPLASSLQEQVIIGPAKVSAGHDNCDVGVADGRCLLTQSVGRSRNLLSRSHLDSGQ